MVNHQPADRQERRQHPDAQPSLLESELSPDEVAQLWSFVHGDIMDTGIRQRLYSFWGLCSRHTWGYAVVEIELWQSGAGVRGGHQPFDVAILYEGLLDHMANALDKPAGLLHRNPSSALIPHGTCYICDLLHNAGVPGLNQMATGYAGSRSAELAAEANQIAYTTAWCRETRPQWEAKVCSLCAQESGASPAGAVEHCSNLCRQHLTAQDPVTPEGCHLVASELRDTAARVRQLAQSMTKNGAPATISDNFSWIEALGWFARWNLPLALTLQPSDRSPRQPAPPAEAEGAASDPQQRGGRSAPAASSAADRQPNS